MSRPNRLRASALAGLIVAAAIAASPAQARWGGWRGLYRPGFGYGRHFGYGPRFGYGARFGYGPRFAAGYGYGPRFGYGYRFGFGPRWAFVPPVAPVYLPPAVVYVPSPAVYVPGPVVVARPVVRHVIHHAALVRHPPCTCVCSPASVPATSAPAVPPALRGPLGSDDHPVLPALRAPAMAQAEPIPSGS